MNFKTIAISIIIILSITLVFFIVTTKKLDQKDKELDDVKIQNIQDRTENYENDLQEIDTVIPIISNDVIISKSDSIIRANGF